MTIQKIEKYSICETICAKEGNAITSTYSYENVKKCKLQDKYTSLVIDQSAVIEKENKEEN